MSEKYKYWMFVLYPDSAPNDWKERLVNTLVPIALSPMHKSDSDDGKPHYHVLLAFHRAVGINTAVKVCQLCGGANGHVERVLAPLGAYEYLTHENNPDKEQFDSMPELLNGFQVPKIKLDDDEMTSEIMTLMFDYNILEICDIVKYYRDSGQTDKATYVFKHANNINHILRSYRFSEIDKANQEKPIDKWDGFYPVKKADQIPFDKLGDNYV